LAESVGTVFLELTLDGQKFSASLKNTEREVSTSSNNMGNSLRTGPGDAIQFLTDKFKQLAIAAATIAGISGIKDLISESALLAARVETLGVVVNIIGNNLGYSSDQMTGFVDNVKKMGITTQEAEQSISRMASAQMDLTKAGNLARIAQDAAVIGNINSSEAFGRMVYAIQSGQPEMLRTLGLNISFEQSYAKLASQLHKTAEELTQGEKTQARMNATLEYGPRIAGAYEAAMGTVGKQILSLARYTEEAKKGFGELFTPLLSDIVTAWTGSLSNLDKTFSKLRESGELQAWGRNIADTIEQLATEFKIIVPAIAAAAAAQYLWATASNAVTAAMERQIAATAAATAATSAKMAADLVATSASITYSGAAQWANEGNMIATVAKEVESVGDKAKSAFNISTLAGAIFNTELKGMLGTMIEIGGIMAAWHFGSELGYWLSGQTEALKKYNEELLETNRENAEDLKYMNERNKLSMALHQAAKDQVPWEDTVNKLRLTPEHMGTEAYFNAERIYAKNLQDSIDAGVDEIKEKFRKAKPALQFSIDISDPKINQFEKEMLTIEKDYQAKKLEYKRAGLLAEVYLEYEKNQKIYNAEQKQLKDFEVMNQGFLNARQKTVDEALLTSGKLFTPPTGALAEVDAWFTKEREVYRNNADIMVKLTAEKEARKTDILREWTIKRMEVEKTSIEKALTYLNQYRDYLVKVYDDAMTKADEYHNKAESIFAFTSQAQKDINTWGQPKKSQADQMADDERALTSLIKEANNSLDPTKMQAAVTSITEFVNKYQGVKNFLGGSEINIDHWRNQAQDLVRNLNLIGMGAKQSGDQVENFANRQLEAIQKVDTEIDYMTKQIKYLDDLIAKTRSFELSTTDAQTKLTGLIEQVTRINELFTMTTKIPLPAMPGTEQYTMSQTSGAPPLGIEGATNPEQYAAELGYPPAASGAYVNKTGLALVHKYETITPAGKSSGGGINFSPNITVSGVNDPNELARLIVKPLQAEMRRQGLLN